MCAYKNGTTIFKNPENLKDEATKKFKIDAQFAFFTDQPMFKQNDYRCLKPSSRLKPDQWPHYEMKSYRAATTEKELKKVKTIKYDKNLFNFEDPEVFKTMTDTKRGSEVWKKVYGFDFVSYNNKKNQPAQDSECIEYCYKAERQKFAKKCRKDGGLFKCCLARYCHIFF